jgi:hypothetical protein
MHPYAIVLSYVEILPTAGSRAAWEARLTAEYGRPVVMRDAYSETRPLDRAVPFWGASYVAGANNTLVCGRA